MRVLLIYPDILHHHRDWTGYYYVGLATLAAVLKQEGHQVSLLHIARKPLRRDEFFRRLDAEAPELIGFSSTSHLFPLVKEMAGWLAEAGRRIPVICGGIHPTIAPEEVIATPGIDMICRGEGEGALSELCARLSQGLPIDDIQNLWIRKGNQVIRNPVRPPISDLDSLPYPDRSIFDYPTLHLEKTGRAMFMASRGCPYDCSYCCNHLLRKISPGGRSVRFRSVDNLLGEIRAVTRQYPFIRALVFDDDILFLNRRWATEFAERYPVEIGLPFVCNARADVTDAGMVALMKKAGCRHVKFGLESGNEEISNLILNRRLTNDQIRKAFALCKQAGLETESFNMVGVPCDTVSTMLDTIKLNAEIGTDHLQATIFQPFYGTKLATFCEEQHLVKSGGRIGIDMFSGSILDLPGTSRAQVLMLRDYFKVLVFVYRQFGRLPAGVSRHLVALTDRLLEFRATAGLLNLIHVPLEAVRQAILIVLMKLALLRQKRVVANFATNPQAPA